jgi:hypothetical protein
MSFNNFILTTFKIGIGLLLAGKLAQVTFNYAVAMAHEQQSGLVSLGHLSRQLNH